MGGSKKFYKSHLVILSQACILISILGKLERKNMSQDNLIKLECTECHKVNYHSHKNKKVIKERLELKKFCKFCKKHTPHKETK
jgi:large subunit ribosomal protein L33